MMPLAMREGICAETVKKSGYRHCIVGSNTSDSRLLFLQLQKRKYNCKECCQSVVQVVQVLKVCVTISDVCDTMYCFICFFGSIKGTQQTTQ